MRTLYYLLLSVIFFGCSEEINRKSIIRIVKNQTQTIKINHSEPTSHALYLLTRDNSIQNSLSWKKYISNINDNLLISELELLERYGLIGPDFGLLDWNDDGYKDLFFEYYGPTGTGVKYRIDVHEYNPKTKKYSGNSYSFMNPSFDYERGIITSHYYGLGGGSAFKMDVKNGIKDTVEYIFLNIYAADQFDSVVYYYSQKPFKDTFRYKDNRVNLPKEYEYVPFLNEDEP